MGRLLDYGFDPVLFIGFELDEIIQYLGQNYNLPPEDGEEEDKEYDLFLFGSRHLCCKLVYLEDPSDHDPLSSFSGRKAELDLDKCSFQVQTVITPDMNSDANFDLDVMPMLKDAALGTHITLMERSYGSKADVDKVRSSGGPGVAVLPFKCYVRKHDDVAKYTLIKRNK